MSEILPDGPQLPFGQKGPEIPGPMHQTIYGEVPAGTEANAGPSPLPEHIDLTTAPELPSEPELQPAPEASEAVPETPAKSDASETESKEPTSETAEFKENIEKAIKEVDALIENIHRLKSADQTLFDEAAYHAEKIRRALNHADPREAGFRQIEQEIPELARRVNQALERAKVDSGTLTSKTELGVEEIKKQLKTAETTTDPTERARILKQCTQIFYELSQTFFSKRLGNDSAEQARKKLEQAIGQASLDATRRRDILARDFHDQNPESLIFQYSKAAGEFTQAFVARSKQIADLEKQIDNDNKTHFKNFEGFITAASVSLSASQSPEQVPESSQTPESTVAATDALSAEEDKNEGINPVQKEVIERALADPDSIDRLKTVIATFGTQEMKDYLKSKLDSLPAEPETTPKPDVNL